jgi:hypothetical protein
MVEPVGISAGFGILLRLLEHFSSEAKKNGVRSKLAASLEVPLNNTKKAVDEFYLSLYTISGATLQGSIMEPASPSECADKIVNDFVTSNDNFISSMRMLTKYLKTHINEFKTFLSDNEILALEAIITTFESSPPDWEFMFGHGAIRELLADQIANEKSFVEELNMKMNIAFENNENLKLMMIAINKSGFSSQQIAAEAMTKMVGQLMYEKFHTK